MLSYQLEKQSIVIQNTGRDVFHDAYILGLFAVRLFQLSRGQNRMQLNISIQAKHGKQIVARW